MGNDDKLKLLRLYDIDAQIRNKKFPNSTTLSILLNRSPRTIKRDIEYLKDSMSAPIEYDYVRKGYYYSEDNYYLPSIKMTESDFFSLELISKLFDQYKGTPLYESLEDVLEKLSQYLPSSISINQHWFDHSFSFFQTPHSKLNPEIWVTVFKGIKNKKLIRIWYQSPTKGEVLSNRIEIYHIICNKGEWYLIAYSRNSKSIRIYAMSRIKRAELQKEKYIIPDDFDIKKYMGNNFGIFSKDGEYKVELNFSKEVAHLIKERSWNQEWVIYENDDGSLKLNLKAGHLLEIKRWVMSWGDEVEVIGPDELRDAIKENIKKLNDKYRIL